MRGNILATENQQAIIKAVFNDKNTKYLLHSFYIRKFPQNKAFKTSIA